MYCGSDHDWRWNCYDNDEINCHECSTAPNTEQHDEICVGRKFTWAFERWYAVMFYLKCAILFFLSSICVISAWLISRECVLFIFIFLFILLLIKRFKLKLNIADMLCNLYIVFVLNYLISIFVVAYLYPERIDDSLHLGDLWLISPSVFATIVFFKRLIRDQKANNSIK
jgi:hypothetical protein